MTVALICIGVVLWLAFLYFFFTPWAMWRRPKSRPQSSPLIGPFSEERALRVERALKRAGVQPIETHGRSRLGIDTARHRR